MMSSYLLLVATRNESAYTSNGWKEQVSGRVDTAKVYEQSSHHQGDVSLPKKHPYDGTVYGTWVLATPRPKVDYNMSEILQHLQNKYDSDGTKSMGIFFQTFSFAQPKIKTNQNQKTRFEPYVEKKCELTDNITPLPHRVFCYPLSFHIKFFNPNQKNFLTKFLNSCIIYLYFGENYGFKYNANGQQRLIDSPV